MPGDVTVLRLSTMSESKVDRYPVEAYELQEYLTSQQLSLVVAGGISSPTVVVHDPMRKLSWCPPVADPKHDVYVIAGSYLAEHMQEQNIRETLLPKGAQIQGVVELPHDVRGEYVAFLGNTALGNKIIPSGDFIINTRNEKQIRIISSTLEKLDRGLVQRSYPPLWYDLKNDSKVTMLLSLVGAGITNWQYSIRFVFWSIPR